MIRTNLSGIIALMCLSLRLILGQCKKEVDPNIDEIHSENGNADIGMTGGT